MKPVLYRYRDDNGRSAWYQADIADARQMLDATHEQCVWFEIDKGDGYIHHWNRDQGWTKYQKLTKEQEKARRERALKECFG